MEVRELTHPALRRYLQERGINTALAQAECKELHFVHNGKPYFAIGFPNVAEGYEVRNRFFKDCIAPKDISHIRKSGEPREKCLVFEGMTDYLSFLTLRMKNCPTMPNLDRQDYVILNSVSNVSKAIDVLHEYERIHCLLDRTESVLGTGRRVCRTYQGLLPKLQWAQRPERLPVRQAPVPIGRTDKVGEVSPIRKADDAATEKARAEDVGKGMLAATRIFANEKCRSLLGNFPSRIASNAENPPISQRGCTSLDSPKPTAKAVQE